jgi:hypothetical protein
MKTYSGSCLCGYISLKIEGEPTFPHLCSCHMCQKWSGALTVSWVDFNLKALIWDGPGGEPAFYRSSEKTQRGFCPQCGGSLCALDDDSDTISITIASLNDPSCVKPGAQHSYQEEAPTWWKVSIRAE